MSTASRSELRRGAARSVRRTRARRVGIAASAAALAFAAAVPASNALFVATATTTFGTTAGSVAIGVTPNPVVTTLTTTNLAPGESVTGPIRVSNIGTLELRYAVTSAVTSPGGSADATAMASDLKLEVKTGVTTCDAAGFGASGEYAYGSAAPVTVASTNVVGAAAPNPAARVLGDVRQGQQAGDRYLLSGASEELCARVTLPVDTTNATQGKTSNTLLTFSAEQRSNNP